MTPAGYAFLRDHFALTKVPLRHESFLGSGFRTEEVFADGVKRVRKTFPLAYAPGDNPLAHIVFSLKYEPPHLDLLRAVFRRMEPDQVAAFIAATPTGAYARRIGFLYEFLTGARLPIPDGLIGGNYQPLLDPAKQVTGAVRKVPRWRIDDNLLGTPAFNPVVTLTPAVQAVLGTDWADRIREIMAAQPAELLHRALAFLYLKETRSSFLIEGETPGREREERFVAFLRAAGQSPTGESLTEARLVAAQKAILDARYALPTYRSDQNYVGSRGRGFGEIVHYIPPPPEFVPSLMAGLAASALRMDTVPALVQAAVLGFAFVFIHPFDDGNGRLHRYLLHDVLTRRGVFPSGTALPLSAAIVAETPAYDRVLEAFSKPLMAQIVYTKDYDGRVMVSNPGEVEGVYRYPDLTPHVEYLATVLQQAIADLPREVEYLDRFDRAFTAARMVVDMPDVRLRRLLGHIEEGGGVLSQNKRKQFDELTDAEVTGIVTAYNEAFRSAE